MITELRQTLTKTEKEAQYDAAAKCLLGEKIILAHILIRTIDEFKGMTADEVVLLIEGEPYIGQVPVEPVYSIWICMNMQENSMCHIHLVQDDLIDAKQWKGDLDIPNIIMIGLSKEIPEQDEKYELHRLLGTLLSEKLSAEEKLQRVSMEYDIPVKGNNVEKEVSIMCNLSQGIKEENEAKGEKKARTEIVLNMHKKGYSLDRIVEITNLDVSAVKAIIG